MRLRSSLFQVFIGCLVLGGCRDYAEAPTAAPGAQRNATSDRKAKKATRSEEQELFDIEFESPGFGGYFMGSDGRLHVLSTSTDGAESAKASIGRRLRDGKVALGRRSTEDVVFERATYTFSELAGWRDLIYSNVVNQKLSFVRGLDADEARNRVLLEYAGPRALAMQQLAQLELDTAALLLRPAVGTKDATSSTAMYPSSIDAQADEIIGGLGIVWTGSSGGSGTCTIGFTALVSGVSRFVTASHCSQIKYNTDSATIHQGPWITAPIIGKEISDPTGAACYSAPWFGTTCRASDAALFAYVSGAPPAHIGLIAKTTYRSGPGRSASTGSKALDPWGPYFVVDALDNNSWVVGTVVDKVGTTTGWTYGPVENTCYDWFGDGNWPNNRGTSCTYLVDAKLDGGDSGGPVFYQHPEGGNRVTLGGIISARRDDGYMIASKFARIQMDLGVTLSATRPVTLSTVALSGSLSGSQPTLSWPAVSGATFYRVTRYWYNYQTGMGSSGDETFTVYTNSFADPSLSAAAYTGGTMPNFSTPGYIRYQVRAFSALESGNTSSIVYFRLP